ncbi:MAG: hypothetical protein VX252_04570 [Myxococcota bacterium]|nr:hypothetical protein [Myxococcota bacterium]
MSSRIGTGLGLALILGVVLAVFIPGGSAWSQVAAKPVLLLLPVRVHSSENPTYLREGLTDMLQARFRQGGVFQLKQVTDPAQSTTNLSEAVAMAREENADFVLFGSFTRFGAGASLDMQAATTALGGSGDSMREIFVHSGSIAEVIPDLDELVGKVTQFANVESGGLIVTPEDGAAPQVESVSSQLQALQSRVEALEAKVGTGASLPAAP